MKRRGALTALSLVMVTANAVCATVEAESFVFAAGNNRGLANDDPLRYAESDAAHVAEALAAVGAAAPRNTFLARGLELHSLQESLGTLQKKIKKDDTLHLFLSAHGDKQGLHINGRVWRWSAIKDSLSQIEARVLLVFIDACHSGYLLTPKGFVSVPRQQIKTTALGPEGRVIITSSGPTELSHESSLLESAPFAHALVSGLRGAADHNSDGQITVGELYSFVYAHAAAATIAAPTGPQRAVQEIRLRGTGEVVVAQSDRGYSRLYRGDLPWETCYVLDQKQERVLTELRPGGAPYIPLVAGPYVVKCLDGTRMHQTEVRITSRDIRLDQA